MQAIGSISVILFTLVASLIFWAVIKAMLGLRVSQEEEIDGLDLGDTEWKPTRDFSSPRRTTRR